MNETWGFAPASAARPTGVSAAPRGDTNGAANEREVYLAELRRRLLAALQIPAGLGTELETRVEMLLGADGKLSDPTIVRSSGSIDFDRAVLEAIKRTRMPPPPGGRSEQIVVPFSTVGKMP